MGRDTRPGADGRSGRLLLPAIPAEGAALALHVGSIRLGWAADPASLREVSVNWEVHFLWDGRNDGSGRKVPIASQPQPFASGRIQIDAVTQLPEGTKIHGHFEDLPPAAIQNMTCTGAGIREANGAPQAFKGCRLGFGDSYRDFEVTYPTVHGEVEVVFRLAFSSTQGPAPTIPPSIAAQAGSIATFRIVVP